MKPKPSRLRSDYSYGGPQNRNLEETEHPNVVGEMKPIELPDMVVEIEPSLWIGECCIYKVPENLWMGNPEAYTPQLISIGPIHRKLEQLWPMENEKIRYYCEFFRRRLSIETQEELDRLNLREFLSEDAEKIKRCYSEKYDDVSMDGFVNMILLDAVFIIELFLRNWDQSNYKEDYLFALPFLKNGIQRDLLLLENQLPFFVLNELYDRLSVQIEGNPNFLHLAHEYFKHVDHYMWWLGEPDPSSLLNERKLEHLEKLNHLGKLKHFTHLIRCYCFPSDFTEGSNSTHESQICATKVTKASSSYDGRDTDKVLKCATKLNNAGVSFRPLSNKFLLEISFEKSNLLDSFPWLSCLPFLDCVKARFKIPQLCVDDRTEYIFRNLIAFEQCHCPKQTYICNYIFLLDYLIDTKEDVELLVEKKVIIHELGSNEEVAALYNNLGKNVYTSLKLDCYGHLIKELNDHYNCKWNHTIAKLRSVYFCDLWRGSSTVVGIAVLFFTFFSFFHSIF